MKKYYKLIKEFPNSEQLNSILLVDEDGDVYFTFHKQVNVHHILMESYSRNDLDMTEYFEESVGISADEYVLFKGDKVHSSMEFSFNLNPDHSTIDHFTAPLYFKAENIPVVKTLPKTWGDLKTVNGYFISINSNFHLSTDGKCIPDNKNVFKTKKQAASALAFAQLSQLVDTMNGDWVPSWGKEYNSKYSVERRGNQLSVTDYNYHFNTLVFKDKTLAKFSLNHHKELWEQYYQL